MHPMARLTADFSGELIDPDHADYDVARRICNGMIDKRPALIARCTGVEDVRAALAYARAENLVVAVRGGGHSTPGYSTCDGGVVIDTGPMKRIEIDPATRTGHFGPGLDWGEFDRATQEHGLAVTGGRVTHTGIAGLTLGSGSGWLERMFGPTCASLISAEVVTADGVVLRASAEENSDLFWGLRGGGGNFGIVTDFEFRLEPVGPIVFGGMVLYSRDVAAELTRFYRDFIAAAPNEVGGGLAFITAPPEDFVPEEARGKPAIALILFYYGDIAAGAEAFRPLLDWGQPLADLSGPIPYAVLQGLIDPGNPWGINEYAKIDYLSSLPDEAIDTMVHSASESRSPFTDVILCPLGGKAAGIDPDAMALHIPDVQWMYFSMAKWWDPALQEAEIGWSRSFVSAMRPWSVNQAPTNFIDPDDPAEGSERLRSSYGPAKYRRLVALKDKYDPDNVFALNGNIPPTRRDR